MAKAQQYSMANFRANLRHLLSERGSQKRLAEAIGRDHVWVGRILKDPDHAQAQSPNVKYVVDIANALQISLDDLFGLTPHTFAKMYPHESYSGGGNAAKAVS